MIIAVMQKGNPVDLIDRQTAIDALWKALYKYEDKMEKQFQDSDELDTGDWFVCRIFVQNMSDIDRQTILELPSAQPVDKDINVSCKDAISRQAAIDALKVAYWDKDIQSSKDDPCIVDAMTDWAIRQVKALPSVQPEPCVDAVNRSDVFNAIDDVAYEVDAGSGNWYRLMNDKVRSLVRI